MDCKLMILILFIIQCILILNGLKLDKFIDSNQTWNVNITLDDNAVTTNLILNYKIITKNESFLINLTEPISQTYSFDNLSPGCEVIVNVTASENGNDIIETVNIKTDLDTVKSFKIYNITNNIAYFNFKKPNGFYDFLFFNCKSDTNGVFSNGIINKSINYGSCTNLKSGDYFIVEITTKKLGFNDVSSSEEAVPSFECTTLSYNEETNTLIWSNPETVILDRYRLDFDKDNDTAFSFVDTSNIPEYALNMFLFDYSTEYSVKITPVLFDLFSKSPCNYNFTTIPCPPINFEKEIEIYDLSNVNSVVIKIKNETFSPLKNILYLDILVGNGTSFCEYNERATSFNKNCFIAYRIVPDDSLWDDNGDTYIPLSQHKYCNTSLCNAVLKMNTQYNVTVIAKSNCNIQTSNTLLLKIKEPFPIEMTLGITLGVSLFIIFMGMFIMIGVKRYKNRGKKTILTNSFDDLNTVKSFPINKIEEKVQKLSMESNKGFSDEFQIIEAYSPKCDVREPSDPRMVLDRYINISADGVFNKTRVKISQTNGDDYINANFVSGVDSETEYIAAQGPLPNTVNDFWKMIQEHDIDFVVMLTNCVDKYGKKCEKYWPELNESSQYGNLTVINVSEIKKQDFIVRFFKTVNRLNKQRIVTQYQYTTWEDHSSPESNLSVLNFIKFLRLDIKNKNSKNPILIHCSAGIGRTGTFITIDRSIIQCERDECIDIFETVSKIRRERCLSVQTENQYMSIYLTMLEYYKNFRKK